MLDQSTVLAPVPEEDGEEALRKKPLLVVLPVDDKRSCGLSSHDPEEARLSGLVGSLAAEFVVPDICPTLGSALWQDNWHFTLEGHKTFAGMLAKGLKDHLCGINQYWDGMTVCVSADSTFDFHNWDAC